MISPKEKAKELANKYLKTGMMIKQAKRCSLIDVNNTLFVLGSLKATIEILKQYRFWFEVRIQIDKL